VGERRLIKTGSPSDVPAGRFLELERVKRSTRLVGAVSFLRSGSHTRGCREVTANHEGNLGRAGAGCLVGAGALGLPYPHTWTRWPRTSHRFQVAQQSPTCDGPCPAVTHRRASIPRSCARAKSEPEKHHGFNLRWSITQRLCLPLPKSARVGPLKVGDGR